jgi:hypothetical protein
MSSVYRYLEALLRRELQMDGVSRGGVIFGQEMIRFNPVPAKIMDDSTVD